MPQRGDLFVCHCAPLSRASGPAAPRRTPADPRAAVAGRAPACSPRRRSRGGDGLRPSLPAAMRALALSAAPAPAEAPGRAGLRVARNLIRRRAGPGFSPALGRQLAGRAGRTATNPRLSAADRAAVGAIGADDEGCRVDTRRGPPAAMRPIPAPRAAVRRAPAWRDGRPARAPRPRRPRPAPRRAAASRPPPPAPAWRARGRRAGRPEPPPRRGRAAAGVPASGRRA